MPPRFAPLPNTTLNMGGFDQTHLGQRALQQRAQYQQRQAQPAEPQAQFYGDTSVARPTNDDLVAARGQRVRSGAPVSNNELHAHLQGLMAPMSRPQADQLSGVSPMPGWDVAMRGAQQRAGQEAFQRHQSLVDAMSKPPVADAQYNNFMARQNPQVRARGLAMVRQPPASGPARRAAVRLQPGAQPGMIPNQEGQRIGLQAPPAGPVGLRNVPPTAPANLAPVNPIFQPEPLHAGGGGGVGPAPDPNLPRDPHIHGVALNPNNAFRFQGGGVARLGVQGPRARPGMLLAQPRPQAPATPEEIRARAMEAMRNNPNAVSALEDQQNMEIKDAQIAAFKDGGNPWKAHYAEQLRAGKSADEARFAADAAYPEFAGGNRAAPQPAAPGAPVAAAPQPGVQAPAQPGVPISPANSTAFLRVNHPNALAALGDAKSPVALTEAIRKLQAMGINADEGPQNPLMQAIVAEMHGIHGAGFEDQIAHHGRPFENQPGQLFSPEVMAGAPWPLRSLSNGMSATLNMFSPMKLWQGNQGGFGNGGGFYDPVTNFNERKNAQDWLSKATGQPVNIQR